MENYPGLVALATLFFLILKLVVQYYLDFRQINHIEKNFTLIPPQFAEQISLEEHQKASHYSLAKLKLGLFTRALNAIIFSLWLWGGAVNIIDQFASEWTSASPIWHGLMFFALFSFVSFLIGLPVSIYSTFILEEKFGHNKTTAKIFITDILKSFFLVGLIAGPLMALILYIMKQTSQTWWIYGWIVFTAFQFVIMWAYPRFLAPIFNKFSPLEEGEAKSEIENLMTKTGFTCDGLFVMDASKRSTHGNAYFTGVGKSKRIVFFDTLLTQLNVNEMIAVLAHELGHFKRKHITKGLIQSLIFSFIGFSILGQLYNWWPFFQGLGVVAQSDHAALLLFSMVSGLFTFPLTPIFSYKSRKNEYEADEFAAAHADSLDLSKALVKLHRENHNVVNPDPIYSKFYYSHPPAMERIAHLESLNQ